MLISMFSTRRARIWYNNHQCSAWYLTLLALLVLQLVLVLQHWRRPGAHGEELLCPGLFDVNGEVTYVKHDNRYKRWDDNWDGRQYNRPINDMVRRIYLVRHGEYHKEGSRQGHLTSLGIAQAHLLGERLKAHNVTFDRFIASSSVRADQTAEILHLYVPYLTIQKSELLKEGWPTYPEPPEGFDPNHPAFKTEGERLWLAYKTFIHRPETGTSRDTNELLVAHGNVIGNFVLRVMQLQPERWLRVNIFQMSLSIIEIDSGGMVRLRSLGDVGHLPKKMWTG